MDPSLQQIISQQFTKFPWQVTDAGFKFLDEKRHCNSYVSCTRIQPYYPPKTQTQGVLNEVFTFSILFRFHNHINHQYIYSPTSIYIFSNINIYIFSNINIYILHTNLYIHFLRCWQGEFVNNWELLFLVIISFILVTLMCNSSVTL